MDEKNQYIVIQKWMIDELHLKGNELIIYALIYGFSQIEDHDFHGSLSYIATWCNIDRRNVLKNLQSLQKKNYIKKEDVSVNNVKMCKYSAINIGGDKTSPLVTKHHQGGDKTSQGVVTKHHQGGDKTSPNNIKDNLLDNLKDNKNERKKENTKATYKAIIDNYTLNDDVKNAIWEFIKMRKLKQNPMTDNALTLMLSKLSKLADTEPKRIEILNQSIEKGWASVYPLKEEKKNVRLF